jgi:hypothetical protein
LDIDDEVYKWIEFSVKYLDDFRSGRVLLDFLCSYIEKDPKITSKLYLKMVEDSSNPQG